MGGFQPPELKTPPKLSLYSLPYSKPPTLPDGLTPPLNTVATVPFLWEEAPGKPRATTHDHPDPPIKSKAVRSLDLPPRLTTTTASPTTVLSGPYVLGSPVDVGSKGKMRRMPLRKLMRKDTSPEKFGSWRWDGDRVERSPSLNLCSWRWDSFRDIAAGGGGGSSFDDRRRNKSLDSDGKVIRKNSFTFTAGGTNPSSFLANMYGTFKKAMTRKSRR